MSQLEYFVSILGSMKNMIHLINFNTFTKQIYSQLLLIYQCNFYLFNKKSFFVIKLFVITSIIVKVGEKIDQLQMYYLNKYCIYPVQRVLELTFTGVPVKVSHTHLVAISNENIQYGFRFIWISHKHL